MADPSQPYQPQGGQPYQPQGGQPYPSTGGQPPPQFPPPYYPPPGPPPMAGPPPRRRWSGGMIAGVIVVGVLGLCCVGGTGVYFLGSRAKPASTTAAAAKKYGTLPDPCTLLAASMVESWAGAVFPGAPDDHALSGDANGKVGGCAYDLRADSVNTFVLHVATDGDATARYDSTVKAFKVFSHTTSPVTGLGAAATSYANQGAETRQIQAGVTLRDGNLYLEIHFQAGGTKPWDPAEVGRHMVDVARAITAEVPKA